MPADFALSFDHKEGSVPPPYHYEWTVEFDAEGAGKATYTPDYGGEGVPIYQASFEVSDADRESIYAALLRDGALEEQATTDDPPIGGALDTAKVTADGSTFNVPAFNEEGEATLDNVADQVRALVPAEDWARFEREGKKYSEKEYGEAP